MAKLAFAAILQKLIHKKPDVYFPLLEEAFEGSNSSQIQCSLWIEFCSPICADIPIKYLDKVLGWVRDENKDLAWAATNLCPKTHQKAR